METLRARFEQGEDFLCGIELVSTRGSIFEEPAVRIRNFASDIVECEDIDWVSITDNAGGNPMLAPTALGKPILYAGKEVVIHLSCKDFNRNGLESSAWQLHSEGFQNILALSGDFPVTGADGQAKPVFDIDSVGLLSLLDRMNGGLQLNTATGGKKRRLDSTSFFLGAVATNFKLRESEVIPQYLKLSKKIECGARFIITQIGYDARKSHELRAYLARAGMERTPLVGNVYVLNAGVARLFHSGRIPGVVVSDALLELVEREATSPDRGKAFFLELAARQMAIFRGLGYRGVYMGGLHAVRDVERILEIERSFAPDDWKSFAGSIRFSRAGEFYMLAEDPATGLCDPLRLSREYEQSLTGAMPGPASSIGYRFSRWLHDLVFQPGKPLFDLGAKLCRNARDPAQGPSWLRRIEKVSKAAIFDCRDCGDCSLPEMAFLCPESQCAKNQRNGPCGGTRDGKCEVGDLECIWSRVYDRLKPEKLEQQMLEHAPVAQDQALRGTSSWANAWLGQDHGARRAGDPGPSIDAAPPGDGADLKSRGAGNREAS